MQSEPPAQQQSYPGQLTPTMFTPGPDLDLQPLTMGVSHQPSYTAPALSGHECDIVDETDNQISHGGCKHDVTAPSFLCCECCKVFRAKRDLDTCYLFNFHFQPESRSQSPDSQN